MSLQERLDAIRNGFERRAPADVLRVVRRVATELRRDALRNALGEGATAPRFALPDPEGVPLDSRDLLAEGPLVVTFFRGKW